MDYVAFRALQKSRCRFRSVRINPEERERPVVRGKTLREALRGNGLKMEPVLEDGEIISKIK